MLLTLTDFATSVSMNTTYSKASIAIIRSEIALNDLTTTLEGGRSCLIMLVHTGPISVKSFASFL